MSKTVVILGGSFGGLHVAHALLKKRIKDLKVILVSKVRKLPRLGSRDTPDRDHMRLTDSQNSHFFWNIASVRAIIPGQIKDGDIFKPLESALSRYPKDSWELIIGTAKAAEFDNKTVDVALSSDNSTRTIAYDQLVLATGSRCSAPTTPWKAAGSYEEVLNSLHEAVAQVKEAKDIVIAGGGSTGVEVAGELGYEFGKTKKITLLCAGDALLNGDSLAAAAANELRKLNVTVRFGARAQDARAAPGGKTEVVLANGGETLVTDLFLPTTGLVPNTDYVPARYLSADERYPVVLVDEYLRVQDAEAVWACGDVVSQPRAGFFITQKQAASVARNVEAALAGREPAVAKGPPVDIFACAVGRGRGVGRMGSFKLPSFGVWLAKGRTLAVQMVPSYIDGSVA
ncbi:hypothetical protein VTK26DRAFT_5186 [Humicola hyalothermophila]